jgi:hypothetical protein
MVEGFIDQWIYDWILKINKKCVNSWLLFSAFLLHLSVSAQSQQYTHDLKDFNRKSFLLLMIGNIVSCQIILWKVKSESDDELKSDCSYYDATWCHSANQANADA